jgi:hypothetical protein
MLPSIYWSHDHSYSKSLSQTKIVGTHRAAGVKIHTLRSMASTINTSHSENRFGGRWRHLGDRQSAATSRRPAVISGTWVVSDDTVVVGGSTPMVDSSTLMSVSDIRTVSGGTLTVGGDMRTIDGYTQIRAGGTLTVGDDTQTVNSITMMVSSGTLMGHGQHQHGSAIASRTQQCCHQPD